MKIIIILIFGITFILSCNGQNRIENRIVENDCEKLNDSSLSLLIDQQDFAKSLELIDLAIKCNPYNDVFIRNKGMILANSGLYQECITFLINNKEKFSRLEFISTITECYFNLKDSVSYDSMKLEVIHHSEKIFVNNKNETNLIAYLTMLKKFDGKKKMLVELDLNKEFLTTPDIYTHLLEFLNKIPTLNLNIKQPENGGRGQG